MKDEQVTEIANAIRYLATAVIGGLLTVGFTISLAIFAAL